VSGTPGPASGFLHRQSEPVPDCTEGCARRETGAAGRAPTAAAYTDWAGTARAGDRMDSGAFAAGQRPSGAELRHGCRPPGERATRGWRANLGPSQSVPTGGVPALVESTFGPPPGDGRRGAPAPGT